MKRVLFVCVENSCRSQMAEAFARLAGVTAHSAGSRPSGIVNPKAIAAMAELGYDLGQHRSKACETVPAGPYEAVVTMGCGDDCSHVPARAHHDWEIPDPKHDETAYSRRVSTLYETTHHELVCGDEEVATFLPTAIWLHDEPLKHANSIPIFLVSRLAKESVTVLLSGEGADEIFGGYLVHRRAGIVQRLHRWGPRWLLRWGARTATRMGRSGTWRAMQAAQMGHPAQRLVWMRSEADPAVVEALISHMPLIRSQIVTYLSDADFLELQTHEGKEALRVAIKDQINELIVKYQGTGEVDEVLFSSFRMQ